jgi:hypothetical protein
MIAAKVQLLVLIGLFFLGTGMLAGSVNKGDARAFVGTLLAGGVIGFCAARFT